MMLIVAGNNNEHRSGARARGQGSGTEKIRETRIVLASVRDGRFWPLQIKVFRSAAKQTCLIQNFTIYSINIC